jgi:hypothetical protein
MKSVSKNLFPVCFLSKSLLLTYKSGIFMVLELPTLKVIKSIALKISFKEFLLNRIPILYRILRKGVRCGVKASENLVLFVIGQRIFELDIVTDSVSNGFVTKDGSRPLAFSKIEGIIGFDDGIYFGGYKSNPERDPISIFKRTGEDSWDEVFQFPGGTIEHIHNIIADPYKNVVYILTGDFENSAGIWMAEDRFKAVIPLLQGDQLFRGCVGFPTSLGLVYATDSPFSDNSIRLLQKQGAKWVSNHLIDTNGPSIYGCNWNSDLVFSTSVEGGGRNQHMWYKIFGRKRGSGVKSDYSVIYVGNIKDGFNEIYRERKDCLPFFLFQFGILSFASGLNESAVLPVFHIATRHNDMKTIFLNKN